MTGAATLASTTTSPFGINGFDFNPAADRARVSGGFLGIPPGATQNARIDVATGATILDTPFAFAAGDPNSGDAQLSGLAYTNNFAGAASTTLYGIVGADPQGPSQATLVVIPSPNAGTLTTVGGLGANLTFTGFDISVITGTAFATTGTQLFTVNLGTGAATLVGNIGTGINQVLGLALNVGTLQPTPTPPPPAAIPEPTTMLLLGTGLAGIAAKVRKRRKANKSEEV